MMGKSRHAVNMSGVALDEIRFRLGGIVYCTLIENITVAVDVEDTRCPLLQPTKNSVNRRVVLLSEKRVIAAGQVCCKRR